MRTLETDTTRIPKIEERLRVALLSVLLLSPLPFGCVEDWSRWLLVTVLAAAFWCVLAYGIPLRLSRREKLAALLGCAALVWMLLQLAPMPPAWLASVSPAAHHLYEIGVPGYGSTDPRGYAYPDPSQIDLERPQGDVGWMVPRLTTWRSVSLYPYGTYRVFWQTAALLGFTLIGLSLFREAEDRARLAAVLVTVGVLESIYGVAETLSGHQHIFGYAKRYYSDVATGTLVNRNHFAAMLNMTLPLAVALLLGRLRAASTQRSSGQHARWAPLGVAAKEPLLVLSAVAIGLGVIVSRSRMGLMAMLVGLTAFAWMASRRDATDPGPAAEPRRRVTTRWAIAMPVALVAIVTLLASGFGGAPAFDRFSRISDDLKQNATRPAMWSEGLAAAGDFIWTGSGAGAYVHALNPHLTTLFSSDFWLYNHAHNDYLEALTTLGAVGLILGLGAIALLACRGASSYIGLGALAGLLTLGFHSLADFLIATPSNALIASSLFCLLGSPQAAHTRTWTPSLLRRAGLVVVAGAILFWPARSMLAAVIYRPLWHTELHRPEAIEALTTAASLDPGYDLYRRWLAQASRDGAQRVELGEVNLSGDFEQQVRQRRATKLSGLASAQRFYLEALDLSPIDYSLHAEMAHVAALTRRAVRESDLARLPEWTASGALASPSLASAALGPTAYANLAAVGSSLWQERLDLGEPYGDAALGILRPVSGRLEIGVGWLEALVKSTHDGPSLARLDEALGPLAYMYDLPRPGAAEEDPAVAQCASVLRVVAEVREAEWALSPKPIYPFPPLTTERLHALRDRMVVLKPKGANPGSDSESAPCGVATPRASELAPRIDSVLAAIDRRLSP